MTNLEHNLSLWNVMGRSSDSSNKLQITTKYIQENYSDWCHIFTDGSYIEGLGGASGVSIPGLSITHIESIIPFCTPILTELSVIKATI